MGLRLYGIQSQMGEKTIFISVGHALQEPWTTIFRSGSEKTWLTSSIPKEFELAHFHGLPLKTFGSFWDRIHEHLRWKNRWFAAPVAWMDTLIGFPISLFVPKIRVSGKFHSTFPAFEVCLPDSYQFGRWKVLAILKYFLEETKCDYIFMTTNNSYVNFNNLKNVVSDLPLSKFYGGAKAYDGAEFAAGNSCLISRDVAQLILKNRNNYSLGLIADSAMGKLVKSLDIDFMPLPSLIIESPERLTQISDQQLKSHFHFRVKSGSMTSRNDVQIMTSLHGRLVSLGEV
jgi:hypothetical protein